jgi:hypothetical protein
LVSETANTAPSALELSEKNKESKRLQINAPLRRTNQDQCELIKMCFGPQPWQLAVFVALGSMRFQIALGGMREEQKPKPTKKRFEAFNEQLKDLNFTF